MQAGDEIIREKAFLHIPGDKFEVNRILNLYPDAQLPICIDDLDKTLRELQLVSSVEHVRRFAVETMYNDNPFH